ncbi:peptidase M3 family protein [Coccomyxa subellipsoidea C-169]|uniref:oligopeptidase A n=1 Tax=Coccomyxa subellipsoidea (strain C-169) TaxID=574566 RepID=I0Z2L6_COCSC|nr:peptidase M3 family protein [Coccomyxa subellipsoidea C-169]EIE24885.1 peptidase M3 family protein [Coccomyxa subellipsoidea C-169]|eukprot:XP_005649429.1 peptidase M3 family protein [Coccomyxa subellipsoidea C-169]
MEADTSASTNPLLTDAPFPLFDQVKAEHVVPGITKLIEDLNAELDELEKTVQPTWSSLVEPLERLTDSISRAWSTVSHLKAVRDSEALRKAVEEVQPLQVKLGLRMAQSKPLYEAFRALRDGSDWNGLSEARKRVVDNELRDFVLGGVALEGEAKERFNEIKQELSQISTKFSNNLLDATKAFKKLITDKADVDGLPASALALGAQQAENEGQKGATAEEGPWLFTLDFPSYQPILTHAKNRAFREEFYRAFITRASSGENDNTPLIERTLALKREQAQLLGYPNYAEVSLASKMATLDKAEGLLEELRGASYDAAVREMDEVKAFATENGFTGELLHWDVSFWAERLREAKFNITDEQLRPYFSLPNVLDGLFKLAGELFGVTVEAADNEHLWHPDVRFFSLKRDGRQKAFFYLDPYSRPAEKRGGAWMDEVVGQSRLLAGPGEAVRLPVAHMVCNQTPPIGDKPSLMTFREVETLFHEFGHALQHMLTQQEEGLVAGIRGVEWDAVELPSQFMENWCYNRETLNSFARHYETGEPLPEDLYQKLVAARTFRSGSGMLRQLHFSELDLVLHSRYEPAEGRTVFESEEVKAVESRTTVLPPLPEDRFLCGFSHIFAGGYAAGYFSYKWAEVLSADAFSAFEEVGLDNKPAVAERGRAFRDTVLALGGGRPPADVFRDFRGRDPSTEPLLRHNDLLPVAA